MDRFSSPVPVKGRTGQHIWHFSESDQAAIIAEGIAALQQCGVANHCCFLSTTSVAADIVISIDAFEHFDNPEEILRLMADCLKPKGVAWISFGPPWYHPYGGHGFSIFPWSHLIFTEWALCEWKRKFHKWDGVSRFYEVSGGLNQMSIHRFKKIVQQSPFTVDFINALPIKGIRLFNNLLIREFLSSCVRCRLRKRVET